MQLLRQVCDCVYVSLFTCLVHLHVFHWGLIRATGFFVQRFLNGAQCFLCVASRASIVPIRYGRETRIYMYIYIHIDWSINAKTYVNILDWRGRIGLQIVGVIGI